MFKKFLIACVFTASLSLISTTFAAEEVHWWHHPDLYQSDFEAWYPEHKDTWATYYETNKAHYSTFCEKHPGWTFCVSK